MRLINFLCLISAHWATAQVTLTINTSVALHKMAEPYLSFNVDTGSIYNGFDWTDPVLINMVYPLNPLNSGGGVIVRIGGTAADYAYYIPDSVNPNGGNGHTIVSNSILEDIWSFAAQSHATVLWDFNGLTFRPHTPFGPWDPSGNATAMLDYLNKAHGGATKWAWSIGNEPEAWNPKPNFTQLGLDAHTLAAVLKNYNVGNEIYGPSCEGLSATNVQEYLTAAKGVVTGVTVHNYPMARDCNVTAYLGAKKNVQAIVPQLAELVQIRHNISGNTKLVLEETAGSYGGGCENITDRYVDGFFWLNILGAVASTGFDRLHRQDIAGWSFTGGMSHYQLAGPPGWVEGSALMTPHPDWYTSVLFKTMIGEVVLNATVAGDPSITAAISLYAWCSGSPWWFNNSAVVTYTNPTGADVTVDLVAVNISAVPRTEYLLTSSASGYQEFQERLRRGRLLTMDAPQAPPDSLTVDAVFLNGAAWSVDSNGILPSLPVVGNTITNPNQGIVLPPYSYGFLQFPGETLKAC